MNILKLTVWINGRQTNDLDLFIIVVDNLEFTLNHFGNDNGQNLPNKNFLKIFNSFHMKNKKNYMILLRMDYQANYTLLINLKGFAMKKMIPKPMEGLMVKQL